ARRRHQRSSRRVSTASRISPSWAADSRSVIMKRRSFIQASFAAACSAAATGPGTGAERQTGLVYELQSYALKAAKQPLLEAYLSNAYVPALKQFGAGPVGVFVEKVQREPSRIYVLTV